MSDTYHPGEGREAAEAIAMKLEGAGWQTESPNIFASDNEHVHMEVHTRPEENNTVLLVVTDKDGRQEELHVEAGSLLDDVLDTIFKHQGSLTFEGFEPFLADVKQVCPGTVGFVDRT